MPDRVYQIADLSPLEQAFLGVLALGLPPASLAGDPGLRLDVLTASAVALAEGRSEGHYLAGDATAPEFEARLSAAVLELDRKGIIALTAPPEINVTLVGVIADAAGRRHINFDQAPRIFDKYLAHACLEQLLQQPPVHAYLMRKYAESSEVWQRLMHQGYGSGPGP